MTRHYPDLGSACDWLKQIFSQLEALSCHQQGISALALQTYISRGNKRCHLKIHRLFSQAMIPPVKMSNFLQIPVPLLTLLYFLKQGCNKEITVY